MDTPDIQVVLAYIEYDNSDNGRFDIKKFGEIEETEYPCFIRLGKWINNGELIFQPHLKVKFNGKRRNADIAIKVSNRFKDKIRSVENDNHEKYREYQTDGYTYYLPPQNWKKNEYTNRYMQGVTHFVTIGSEKIIIIYSNHTESMCLTSKKPPEAYNFYLEMIQDLLKINQQLCMDDTSAMSMSLDWSRTIYEDTKKQVDEFCDEFWKMHGNAKRQLQQKEIRMPYYKVKKITPKTLIDHEIMHKDKVRTISSEETIDTFEHRAVKTYANSLNKLIDIRDKMEREAFENDRIRLENGLSFSRNELEKLKKEKESIFDLKREKVLNRPLERKVKRQIYMQIRICKTQSNGYFFDYNFWNQNALKERDFYSMALNADVRGCRYVICDNNRQKIKNYDSDCSIRLKIPMRYEKNAAFAYDVIDSEESMAESGDVIAIFGEAYTNYYSEWNNKICEFEFFNIMCIDFFEQTDTNRISRKYKTRYWLSKRKENSAFNEHVFKMWMFENSDEFLLENFENMDEIREIDLLLEEEQKASKWNELHEKIDKVLSTQLMKETGNENTTVKTSNLFLFEPAYNGIYQTMIKNREKVNKVDYVFMNEDNFPIAKLSDLYETWCFVNIIKTFIINYGFKIEESSEDDQMQVLKEIINDILIENGNIRKTVIRLSGNIQEKKMFVTLWYERVFKDIDNPDIFLTPDFFMQISYDGMDRLFVFDAKDRTGEDYDGISDLYKIAFKKYTLGLENKITREQFPKAVLPSENMISGSFILQSCKKPKEFGMRDIGIMKYCYKYDIALNYTPKRYLGSCPDIYADLWMQQLKLKNEKQINEFKQWANWKQSIENNENKIGIVTMNPGYNGFVYIIQMIMEQQFGLYREKCWICGGNVKVIEGKTRSYKQKYHIYCPKCKTITVETHCKNKSSCPSYNERTAIERSTKLGKHRYNYYAAEWEPTKTDKENWNVVCPFCRETASKSLNPARIIATPVKK